MDPFSALAVAAAVVRFLDSGGNAFADYWEKYQELGNLEYKGCSEEQREEEKQTMVGELQEIVGRLTALVSEAQLPSTDCLASQPATPAQQQLINAASECSNIRANLNQIADRFVAGSNNKTNPKVRRPLTLFCRSKSQKPTALSHAMSEEIMKMENQYEVVRSQAIDSILLCLWENSKQNKQREGHFGTYLSAALGMLETIEKQTIPPTLTDQARPANEDHTDFVEVSLDGLNDAGVSADRVKLRDAALLLVEAGQSISLVEFGKEMTKALGVEREIPQAIRNELVEVLWKEDWEMDMSTPGVSATGTSPNLDNATVGQAISTSARFDGTDAREAAISKSFEDTYSWILDSKPPEQNGWPLWESFPKWLAEDSSSVYWITGKPGSGKSTMMKSFLEQPLLREYLSRELGVLRLLVVRYYAWNAGKYLQKSIEGLKRTIISQVLELDPQLTLKLAPRRWVLCQVLRATSSLPRWDTWEIEEVFKALLSQCGKTIKLALFIDGLDEFDTPPKDVVHQIREMTALCPTGLKICVASRPWNTFGDEFCHGPVLEMHLLTHKDMSTFVAGSFKANKAFAQHQAQSSQTTSQLISNVVKKANGVFQWVSLVVPLLLDLLTDGESPTQSVDLQQVLQDLPSELEALYETIWANIQPENLPMASFMMQIMRAAGGPVLWLTMWAVEDLKELLALPEPYAGSELSPDMIDEFRVNPNVKIVVKMQLKKKLADRTKGVLELNSEGDGFVDFVHRTAREWAANPETSERICNTSDETLDPHLYLLEADALTLFYRSGTWSDFEAQLRDAVLDAFWHASKVAFIPENTKKLIKCLDILETACRGLGGDNPTKGRSCWAPARFDADNTFLGLAAQFSILPYIECALRSDHGHQHEKSSKDFLGLLENAIFGPLYYNPPKVPQADDHPIPRDQRLATVRYLLKHGVYPSEVHTWSGVRYLKDELEKTPSTNPEFEYYAAVLACLNEMSKLTRMRVSFKSALGRLRYRVGLRIKGIKKGQKVVEKADICVNRRYIINERPQTAALLIR